LKEAGPFVSGDLAREALPDAEVPSLPGDALTIWISPLVTPATARSPVWLVLSVCKSILNDNKKQRSTGAAITVSTWIDVIRGRLTSRC
jgi:hypothetical protein